MTTGPTGHHEPQSSPEVPSASLPQHPGCCWVHPGLTALVAPGPIACGQIRRCQLVHPGPPKAEEGRGLPVDGVCDSWEAWGSRDLVTGSPSWGERAS